MTFPQIVDAPRKTQRLWRRLTRTVLSQDLTSTTDADLRTMLTEVTSTWGTHDALMSNAAVVTELVRRHMGLTPHPNQILAGMLMCTGSIVELATGEGKTIASLYPTIYWALRKEGVHVVTANPYLAQRDAETLLPVYTAAGLTVGVTLDQLSVEQRRQAHLSDVVYGTAARFGFDYLFDQLTLDIDQRVTRKRFAAVVDEVDAVLLDEATTPLVISGEDPREPSEWDTYTTTVGQLHTPEHVTIDETTDAVSLTEAGHDFVDELLGRPLTNSSDDLHHIDAALKARFLFHRDRDYIVDSGQVITVDPLTGRRQPDRRYQNSIHEAIESKEGVQVRKGQTAVASMTVQAMFRSYPHLCGMTGTVGNDAAELTATYATTVHRVTTHHPTIRKDQPDRLFLTAEEKITHIVTRIKEETARGRPVMLGCPTVKESERLHTTLLEHNVEHQLLNAKNPGKEAHVVAQAGRPGAVTVTTAMAGRGVDIKLGGCAEGLAAHDIGLSVEAGHDPERHITDPDQRSNYHAALSQRKASCEADREKVIEAGGLLIIGTSRHSSRRADDQLRGRAGRQGEPGGSQFFLSTEDDIVRTFGAEQLSRALAKLSNSTQTAQTLTKVFRNAQRKVDERNRRLREQLLKFDQTITQQRNAVYAWRDRIHSQSLETNLTWWFTKAYAVMNERRPSPELVSEHKKWEELLTTMYTNQTLSFAPGEDLPAEHMAGEQAQHLLEKWKSNPPELLEKVITAVLVDGITKMWREQMVNLDILTDSIGFRTYAQKNPITEFELEGYTMFTEAVNALLIDKATEMSNATVGKKPPTPTVALSPTPLPELTSDNSAPTP